MNGSEARRRRRAAAFATWAGGWYYSSSRCRRSLMGVALPLIRARSGRAAEGAVPKEIFGAIVLRTMETNAQIHRQFHKDSPARSFSAHGCPLPRTGRAASPVRLRGRHCYRV